MTAPFGAGVEPAMKKSYLVVHDYGTGGALAVIQARSESEISGKYRDLTLHTNWSSWMTSEHYNRLTSIDIDDPPSGWLIEVAR